MGCSCGCKSKGAEKVAAPEAEKRSYVCYQCNTVKQAQEGAAVPECCGKKMQEVD